MMKTGGSLARTNASLRMEVKRLKKKLGEKPETKAETEGEMVEKLSLQNTF
jgi:hypothetical protein